MAKLTIYLPDTLDRDLKTRDDINLSGVCQTALRTELARKRALAERDPDMTDFVVFDNHRNTEVRFTGRKLATGKGPDGWEHSERTAYLTKHHRIAVHTVYAVFTDSDDADNAQLDVYDTWDEFAGKLAGEAADLVAAAAAALEVPYIVDLDI